MKTKVIYTDNPPFNQKGEVETKETPKADKDELYGGNPLVYSDALEQMKNVRKLLKDRLKPVKDNGEAIEDATATEKVRLQGSKESKIPSLKPYTEAVDVKDRASLSKLVEKAKKEKKLFKIGRSMKEGFRYTFLIEEMVKEEVKPEFKVGNTVKIISMAGEPGYTGKVGKITMIDDAGQLHGTWGGLALIPGDDKFELVSVINNDTGKIEEKKEIKEVFFFGDGTRFGTKLDSFKQAKELGKGTYWPVSSDEKYFDMYTKKGYELFVNGTGKDRILTVVKNGDVVNAFDVDDKLVVLEKLISSMKPMPKMEGAPEEHHHDEEHKDEGEYDEEGDMAKSDLQIMADAALELHGMLADEENLPEWVQAKITLATDYIDTARDYMKAKKEGTELPEPKEDEEMIKEEASASLGKKTGVITVAQYKDFLNDALEVVANADDTEKVRLSSNTYNMDLPYIGTYGGYIAINSPISEDQSEDEEEELDEAKKPLGETSNGSFGKEIITLQEFATAVEKLGRDDIDMFPILKGIAAGTIRAFISHGDKPAITILRGDVVEDVFYSKPTASSKKPMKENNGPKGELYERIVFHFIGDFSSEHFYDLDNDTIGITPIPGNAKYDATLWETRDGSYALAMFKDGEELNTDELDYFDTAEEAALYALDTDNYDALQGNGGDGGLEESTKKNSKKEKKLKEGKQQLNEMLIDLILDRKDGSKYSPEDFYRDAMQYSGTFDGIADAITRAMDEGTEEEVKKALCDYVLENDYNPKICDFINSVKWLEADLEEVLVEPKKGEKEADYVSRFMGSKQANKDFPNQKQRAAVAYSKFNAKKEGAELKEAPLPETVTETKFFPGEDGDVEAHIFTDSEGIEDFDLRWDDKKGGYTLSWEVRLDEAKKPEGKKEVISTTLTDDGVLKIFLGNSILAEIEDGKNTESFIKDTLHGMGYIWNKDGTVSKKKEEGKKPLGEKINPQANILELEEWAGNDAKKMIAILNELSSLDVSQMSLGTQQVYRAFGFEDLTEKEVKEEVKGLKDEVMSWLFDSGDFEEKEAEELSSLLESKKPLEEKKLKEDTTILSSLNEFQPWSGAVSTWELIVEADKVDALDFMLEDLYPEGITSTELNDLLWFESSWVLDMLKISGTGNKEKPETDEETEEEATEETGEDKEDIMSTLNDIEDEPVVNVTGNELEEAKHAHHKKENQEEIQEVKENTGNVFKEVQDFIAKTVSK